MNLAIVSRLIEMGRTPNLDDPGVLKVFADLRDKGEEVLYGLNQDIIIDLTTEEITALVKAMTIAEDRWQWRGGSVSPIIRVFEELEKRDLNLSQQVAEWIVVRSKFNTYVPFRHTRRRGALLEKIALRERETAIRELKRKNISVERQILERSDPLAWEKTKNEWLNAHLETKKREELRQHQAQEQRAREIEAELKYKAAKRLESQRRSEIYNLAKERNTQKRQEFSSQGENLTPSERLRFLSENTDYPISCFPSDWADVSDDVLKTIHPDIRNTLLKRLEGKPKGPWRKFYVRLRDIQM